jgi:hypothetical protein
MIWRDSGTGTMQSELQRNKRDDRVGAVPSVMPVPFRGLCVTLNEQRTLAIAGWIALSIALRYVDIHD